MVSNHQQCVTIFLLLQASGVWYATNHTNDIEENLYKCASVGVNLPSSGWDYAKGYLDMWV
jgi:hypothetical protein